MFFDQQGQPVFVDPAVSYGNREQDIAMSQLFGGFRPEFLDAYQTIFPLEEGWEDRLPIYQLYYFLAHLNMFGETYGSQVDQLLEKDKRRAFFWQRNIQKSMKFHIMNVISIKR